MTGVIHGYEVKQHVMYRLVYRQFGAFFFCLLVYSVVNMFTSLYLISDEEAGCKVTSLITIILPVVFGVFVLAIIVVVTLLSFWKIRKQQKQDSSQESLDQDYEVPDSDANSNAAESPHVMKSNIAYSSIIRGQQRSTDVLQSEAHHCDMKPNIAYGYITSDQHSNDGVPSETQYYEVSTL